MEDRLRAYLDEVLRANEQFNLTAVRDPETAWTKHILDSLEGARTQLFADAKKVIDIGTGPGFPGAILAIAHPHLEVTLLESIGKKCRFLEEAARKHAPNAGVLCARAEEAAHNSKWREAFDIATARAVGSFTEVCELALPFVEVGGSALLWRGQNAPEEVDSSRRALHKLGGEARVLKSYRLPCHELEYYLVQVNKQKRTPPQFPRRVGLPKQKPL